MILENMSLLALIILCLTELGIIISLNSRLRKLTMNPRSKHERLS